MRHAIMPLGLLAMLAAAAATALTAGPSTAPSPSAAWDDYRLILDRNIFSRDRVASQSRSRYSYSRPSYQPSEHLLILAGVAVQGDLRVAFFEDTRVGETIRATAGQDVGGGTVVAVSLDSVEYRSDGTIRTIRVGENLTGSTPTTNPSLAASQPAGGDSEAASRPSSPGTPSDTGTNSVLERMRLRRLQELKQ